MRAAILALVLLASRAAMAQECHPVADPATHELPSVALRTGLALESAAIDDGLGRSGYYEGAIGAVELTAFGARARVSLGAYHVDWGQRGTGIGDLQLAVQRGVVSIGAVQLGAAVGATLPTGDVMNELGMGHPMIMPGGFARWSMGGTSVLASAAYGTMLGSGHHHASIGPIPSPMNAEEIAGALRAAHDLRGTELSATASGAVPIGMGSSRAALGAGARWRVGETGLGLEFTAPFGGTPIHARLLAELTRDW